MTKSFNLFIGACPAPELSKNLMKRVQMISSTLKHPVQLIQAEDLHVTLAYIPRVQTDSIKTIIKSCHVAVTNNIICKTNSITQFNSAVTLSLQTHQNLEIIRENLINQLSTSGFDVDIKAFKPHLTLFRLPKNIKLSKDECYRIYESTKDANLQISTISLMGRIESKNYQYFHEFYQQNADNT